MATNAEILAALQTAALAQATGGMVEAYTLPDGTQIRASSAKDLNDLIGIYRSLVEQDAGQSRFRLARTRPAS